MSSHTNRIAKGSLDGSEGHPEGSAWYIHDWKSNWCNNRDFADYLHEDIRIREHMVGKLSHAGLSDIIIRKDRTRSPLTSTRPGPDRDGKVRCRG